MCLWQLVVFYNGEGARARAPSSRVHFLFTFSQNPLFFPFTTRFKLSHDLGQNRSADLTLHFLCFVCGRSG